MSNIPNKTKITTAVSNSSKFDLDSSHVTTSNFMELNVAKSMELVPRQSIKVNHRVFSRLEPLVVPSFGMGYIHNKSFFVPYRTVFSGWNDFINDVPHSYPSGEVEHISSVPCMKNSQFLTFFLYPSISTLMGPNADLDTADFVYIQTDSSNIPVLRGYQFTPLGRRAFKILTSLGYSFSFNAQDEDSLHSMLPLLSLVKIYLDWYFPNNYVNTNLYITIDAMLKYDSTRPFYEEFSGYSILEVFQLIDRVCYDSDYFVSSWDNPVAPNDDTYGNLTIIDTTQPNSVQVATTLSSTEDGTPVIPHQQNRNISQFMLNSLRAVTDYMKRHQIVGARVIDRYLSRWGITLDSAKLDRSLYLSEYSQILQFSDVTSTADTDGARLGDYSGKGISKGGGVTEFKNNDEFGHFIIVSSIIPDTGYYQGRDRTTQHLTKLDFFTPEFDGLGVQALATSELFMPMDSRKMYPERFSVSQYDIIDSSEKVFAFIPRYGEYKRSHNVLSGDFRLNSRNAGQDSWTLFRNVEPYFAEDGIDTKHSVDFVLGRDSDQYNRIFYNTTNDADHFKLIHHFYIDTIFPGKSLFDNYEFENEDTAQKVSVDAGGVKAN